MDSPAEIVEMQSQLPVYAAYTPNLLPSTFFVDDDDWRADPSMWANDDFTPAFVENSGLVASDLTNNLPVTEYEFRAEDENYMVSSDAHRLDEGSDNIQKIVNSDKANIDYPEWWKSKLTVAATEVDQLSDFLSFVTSNKSMWCGFSAESSVAGPEFTEEGYPIMIEDIAFPGLSYVYYELRPGFDGSSEEIVYILNPFTADRESLEEINAALDSGYLELYKVIPVSEMEKEFAAEYRPGLIKAKKLDLIPPAEITAGKFLGMGTCSGCNTMDTEIFQGVPYSLCESCYDETYLAPCSVCNLEGDVHDMYLDEDMGIEDVLICDECIDNYAK